MRRVSRKWQQRASGRACLRWSLLAVVAVACTAGAPDGLALRDEPITPVPQPAPEDPLKAALGRALFEDVRLSRDGSVSCASCHDLRGNGAMPARPVMGPGGIPTGFDTQTVFNAALSFRLDWEGNARTLEAQAVIAIESPDIMDSTVDGAVARLRDGGATERAFHAAYGHGPDREAMLDAIATFERTLLTPGSRFDQWLLGDDAALTAQELQGYRTFKAVGCVSCHQGVNAGGNLFQPHGVFIAFGGPAPSLVRVPSLRNIEATAPYFHDGSAATLEDAIRTMSTAQLGRTLSPDQVGDIIAFLRTLTGRYAGRPVEGAWAHDGP